MSLLGCAQWRASACACGPASSVLSVRIVGERVEKSDIGLCRTAGAARWAQRCIVRGASCAGYVSESETMPAKATVCFLGLAIYLVEGREDDFLLGMIIHAPPDLGTFSGA